ncbi:hypothetical protein HYU22_04210 [Candidatus Woesearchaeota archaeon]|nr:hypothetical protein [Candidatus Woesearchaeota archaeon]
MNDEYSMAKLSAKITMYILVIGVFFRIGLRKGQEQVLDRLPREQRPIIQRIIRSGIGEEQIEKSERELENARAALIKARQAESRGDRQNALDWIINARGHLEKVNRKAFDLTKLRAELQLVQRSLFLPR